MGKKENNIEHKEKILADVMNKVHQPNTSIVPIKGKKSAAPKPKALINFNSQKKLESESDSESTTFSSDSEPEETDIFENNEPDNLEELKARF